jgi:phosphonopyruvate decarboxylase
MITPKHFYTQLKNNGVSFFTGVPDSLLKEFCSFLTENIFEKDHIINVNEGAALSLGAGIHLATGKIPLIYMQNSGLGNIINPLLSLVDKEVYSIPMLLLIGWRGEPNVKDEPQHFKQGRVTISLLDSMEIPYKIIGPETDNISLIVNDILKEIREKKAPCAIVVKKNTFEKHFSNSNKKNEISLSREKAIKTVVGCLLHSDVVVSTTGKISRELFEYRKENKQSHSHDFLTVGSMGHASQIALGIALQSQNRNVYCFDGDGAALMHMGSLAIIGNKQCDNFKHIIFNNGAHDSVGGQPTIGFEVGFANLARTVGYQTALLAKTSDEIIKNIEIIKKSHGPAFLEIHVQKGARKDLGRPSVTPIENKVAFMDFLRHSKAVE